MFIKMTTLQGAEVYFNPDRVFWYEQEFEPTEDGREPIVMVVYGGDGEQTWGLKFPGLLSAFAAKISGIGSPDLGAD